MNVAKRFDDFLASRWVLWGISLAAAVFMWFYVMDVGSPGNERRKLLTNVEYRDLAPQLSVKSVVDQVEVEVEAPEDVMSRLRYDSIICEVDVKGLSAGKYRLTVRTSLPQNINLVSVYPSELDVELIRQVGRVFPVEVILPQDIPSGHYLEAVELVPKEIAIKGYERDLAKIGSVNISPTVQELETGKELLLPLHLVQSEPFEGEVTLEPSQVRMKGTLVRGLPRKRVAVNVRLSGKPSEDYVVQSVTTDPAEVMLEGPRDKLDAISAVETEMVEISNLSADQTLVVPLRPLKDKDVTLLDAQSVRLLINLEPVAAQKQFSNIPVSVEGPGKEKWVLQPPFVTVTVEALPTRMESLHPDSLELKAYVDVSNLFLRSATLPVRAEIASGDVRVVRIDPLTVLASMAEE